MVSLHPLDTEVDLSDKACGLTVLILVSLSLRIFSLNTCLHLYLYTGV